MILTKFVLIDSLLNGTPITLRKGDGVTFNNANDREPCVMAGLAEATGPITLIERWTDEEGVSCTFEVFIRDAKVGTVSAFVTTAD